MEKPGNSFVVAKMCEKHLKEKEIFIITALLKMYLFDWSFQFLLMQINHPISPYVEFQLQMG